MNKRLKKEEVKRNKILTYSIVIIILIIALSYSAYKVYGLIQNPTDTYLITNGKLSLEESVVGYVIRDEEVLAGENYKNGLQAIKAEGERVAKGETMFSYHNKNEEQLSKKIEELDVKISEAMENDNNILPVDLQLIEEQVESKLDEVYKTNELQKINEYKKEINSTINKKAKMAGELSPNGSYLKGLIEERTQYANELNSGLENVTATRTGIVSYRIDGLEEVLKPGDFSYLSKSLLEGLNLKTGQVIATSDEKGKIIDNFVCYIAAAMESNMTKEAEIGDSVTIRLSTADEVSAQIVYISEENEEERLLVFEIKECVEKLIDCRKISFDVIWWESIGLKIPNSAIRYDGELTYVTRNRAGYLDEILVKVKKKNENYSIIENYTSSELKEIGYTDEQLSERNTISLYDEIVIRN